MKTLTILLTLLSGVAMGQVKYDSTKTEAVNRYHMCDTAIAQICKGCVLMPVYEPRTDTTEVWLKEVSISDFGVYEYWKKGFKVTIDNGCCVMAFDDQPPPRYAVYYLEADRKTKVTNTVLYSVPRK